MNQECLFDFFIVIGGRAVVVDEDYQVIYTELLKRGISIKLENKLILGIGDNDKESA